MASQIYLAALEYVERGFKVLPLREREKIPVLPKWQTYASDDLDKVEEWFGSESTNSYNIGVQLGPRSGIIDVEYDSVEGQKVAAKLFGEVYTPTYSSGNRSAHRLFLWQEGLPQVAVIKTNDLELRLGGGNMGAQSVFPPSIHPSGSSYQWVPGLSLSDVDIQPVPESLLIMLANDPALESLDTPLLARRRSSEHWERIVAGKSQVGERNNDITSFIGLLLSGLSDRSIEDPKMLMTLLGVAIETASRFTDPLAEKEVEAAFRSIVKKEQHRRITEASHRLTAPTVDDLVNQAKSEKPADATGNWRLVIVRADPPVYDLYAPHFAQNGGKITLSGEALLSSKAIELEALKQSEATLPPDFHKAWNKGGLRQALIRSAEKEEAPPEMKRHIAIMQLVYDVFQQRRKLDTLDDPSPRGVWEDPEGNLLFQFAYIHKMISLSMQGVTRNELSKILQQCDPERAKRAQREYLVISPDKLRIFSDVV